MSGPAFPCTPGRNAEACTDRTECDRAGLCLASDAGVAYQEAGIRRFFEALFKDMKGKLSDDEA